MTGDNPGGTPRHFCVPEYAASIPQPSTSSGMPPSDVTVSTSSRVSVSLQGAERCDRVLDPGRGLGVDDGDEPGVGPLPLRLEQRLRIDRATPRCVDTRELGAGAAGHFTHPFAEHPVHTDDHVITRLDEVHEARFHPCRTRSRSRAG